MKKQLLLVVLLAALIFISCDNNKVYDSNIDLDSDRWKASQELQYNISIQDSSIPYNLYYNVRYTDEYPFHNLYVTYYLNDTTGKELRQELQNMNLFDPKTGVPLGSGLGKTYDHSILAVTGLKFPYSGTYTFKVKQYMRQEQLVGIKAFGIKVVKQIAEK